MAIVQLPLLRNLGIGPSDLSTILCGCEGIGEDVDFDFQKVFRVIMDDDMLDCEELRDAFWGVISRMTPKMKRQLLFFWTGDQNVPAPGTQLLRIEMPFVGMTKGEHKAILGMLPQAHTCENILEVPNYWEAAQALNPSVTIEEVERIIQDKFICAIENTSGYGLDEGANSSMGRGNEDRAEIRHTENSSSTFSDLPLPRDKEPPISAETETKASQKRNDSFDFFEDLDSIPRLGSSIREMKNVGVECTSRQNDSLKPVEIKLHSASETLESNSISESVTLDDFAESMDLPRIKSFDVLLQSCENNVGDTGVVHSNLPTLIRPVETPKKVRSFNLRLVLQPALCVSQVQGYNTISSYSTIQS